MYGDTEILRVHARSLRTAAGDVRTRGLATASAASTDWVSTAAGRFREDIELAAADLRVLADEVDEAARDLELHADQVDETKAAIRAAQDWVDDQVYAAHGLIASAVDAAADAVTDFVTGAADRSRDLISIVTTTALEPGSVEWLTLRRRIESL